MEKYEKIIGIDIYIYYDIYIYDIVEVPINWGFHSKWLIFAIKIDVFHNFFPFRQSPALTTFDPGKTKFHRPCLRGRCLQSARVLSCGAKSVMGIHDVYVLLYKCHITHNTMPFIGATLCHFFEGERQKASIATWVVHGGANMCKFDWSYARSISRCCS